MGGEAEIEKQRERWGFSGNLELKESSEGRVYEECVQNISHTKKKKKKYGAEMEMVNICCT